MSGDDKDDDITVVASHSAEYASSEPGSSPQRIKTGKPRLTEAEFLRRDAIQHYNVDPIVYLKTPQQQKRQIIKKSLFSTSQDDVSMPTPAEPTKQLSDEDFAEEQIHLIPKLPGQTTDDINIPTRETFEYAYKNFTDPKVRQYLLDVQSWLYFIRYHNKPDCSIPILDHTGKPYTEVTNWTLQDIDALPANATKLRDIQAPKHKQLISVPTDTAKTTKTGKSTTAQTVKSTSTPNQYQYHKHLQQQYKKILEPLAHHHLLHLHHIEIHQLHHLIHHLPRCLHYVIEQYFSPKLHLTVKIKLKLAPIYKVLKIL